jgi:hypothetical protein
VYVRGCVLARYLTTLASLIYKWMCIGYWCSDTDRGNRSTWRKTCPSVTLSITNLTLTALVLNPALRCEKSGYKPPELWHCLYGLESGMTAMLTLCVCERVCTCVYVCVCVCTGLDRRSTFRLLVPVFLCKERWRWMVAFPTFICECIRTCSESRLTLFANGNQILMSHKIICKAKICLFSSSTVVP